MDKTKDFVTEDDEVFVHKTKLISKSTKKTIEFHDFLKVIEDEDQNKKQIISPKFKLAGVDFSIDVYPDNSANSGAGFFGVYLQNYGKEDQIISMTIKEVFGSVTKMNFVTEMQKAPGFKGWGCPKFMSHEKYRQLAKVHGDVLKLDVVVTLHTKAEGDGWTR